MWCGFNSICLSWLPSQVYLTLPSSFQLFFLIHFFSSSLSSLATKQAEEKNAEPKQVWKERKCVQTILLRNWTCFSATLPFIHPQFRTNLLVDWIKASPGGLIVSSGHAAMIKLLSLEGGFWGYWWKMLHWLWGGSSGGWRGGLHEAQHLPNETARDKNVQLPVIISLITIILWITFLEDKGEISSLHGLHLNVRFLGKINFTSHPFWMHCLTDRLKLVWSIVLLPGPKEVCLPLIHCESLPLSLNATVACSPKDMPSLGNRSPPTALIFVL